MRAAIFPGQGVQASGMLSGLEERAAWVYTHASEELGIDMVELCREGRSKEADLRSTRWAQPAIVTASVGAFEVLRSEGHRFDAIAGHSLGEYSALVAAGALPLRDAVRLVAVRAEAMDLAATQSPGGMVAVLGADLERVTEIAEQAGACIAGDNAPGQLVISGETEAINAAVSALEESGARCVRVKVAGAFHSPAMRSAVPILAEALREASFEAPRTPVWSSTTAAPLTSPQEIRDALEAQLTSPVRWRETVLVLAEAGVRTFCDAGPGKVVANLARRTLADAEIETVEEILRVPETADGGRA